MHASSRVFTGWSNFEAAIVNELVEGKYTVDDISLVTNSEGQVGFRTPKNFIEYSYFNAKDGEEMAPTKLPKFLEGLRKVEILSSFNVDDNFSELFNQVMSNPDVRSFPLESFQVHMDWIDRALIFDVTAQKDEEAEYLTGVGEIWHPVKLELMTHDKMDELLELSKDVPPAYIISPTGSVGYIERDLNHQLVVYHGGATLPKAQELFHASVPLDKQLDAIFDSEHTYTIEQVREDLIEHIAGYSVDEDEDETVGESLEGMRQILQAFIADSNIPAHIHKTAQATLDSLSTLIEEGTEEARLATEEPTRVFIQEYIKEMSSTEETPGKTARETLLSLVDYMLQETSDIKRTRTLLASGKVDDITISTIKEVARSKVKTFAEVAYLTTHLTPEEREAVHQVHLALAETRNILDAQKEYSVQWVKDKVLPAQEEELVLLKKVQAIFEPNATGIVNPQAIEKLQETLLSVLEAKASKPNLTTVMSDYGVIKYQAWRLQLTKKLGWLRRGTQDYLRKVFEADLRVNTISPEGLAVLAEVSRKLQMEGQHDLIDDIDHTYREIYKGVVQKSWKLTCKERPDFLARFSSKEEVDLFIADKLLEYTAEEVEETPDSFVLWVSNAQSPGISEALGGETFNVRCSAHFGYVPSFYEPNTCMVESIDKLSTRLHFSEPSPEELKVLVENQIKANTVPEVSVSELSAVWGSAEDVSTIFDTVIGHDGNLNPPRASAFEDVGRSPNAHKYVPPVAPLDRTGAFQGGVKWAKAIGESMLSAPTGSPSLEARTMSTWASMNIGTCGVIDGSVPVSAAKVVEVGPTGAIVCPDANSMLHEIRNHVFKTGETVTSSDIPENRQVGFKSSGGTHWVIDVTSLMNRAGRLLPPDVARAFLTLKSRESLAAFLSKSPGEELSAYRGPGPVEEMTPEVVEEEPQEEESSGFGAILGVLGAVAAMAGITSMATTTRRTSTHRTMAGAIIDAQLAEEEEEVKEENHVAHHP